MFTQFSEQHLGLFIVSFYSLRVPLRPLRLVGEKCGFGVRSEVKRDRVWQSTTVHPVRKFYSP